MQPARTCLYNCNPFDYDLSEEEIKEAPSDKALRLVQEELDSSNNKKRTILLLVELEVSYPIAKLIHFDSNSQESIVLTI